MLDEREKFHASVITIRSDRHQLYVMKQKKRFFL